MPDYEISFICKMMVYLIWFLCTGKYYTNQRIASVWSGEHDEESEYLSGFFKCFIGSKIVNTIQRRQGSRSLSPLIVSRDSYITWTLARFQMTEHCPLLRMPLYVFWYSTYYHQHLYYNFNDLSAWDGCWSLVCIWRFIYKLFFF